MWVAFSEAIAPHRSGWHIGLNNSGTTCIKMYHATYSTIQWVVSSDQGCTKWLVSGDGDSCLMRLFSHLLRGNCCTVVLISRGQTLVTIPAMHPCKTAIQQHKLLGAVISWGLLGGRRYLVEALLLCLGGFWIDAIISWRIKGLPVLPRGCMQKTVGWLLLFLGRF